MNVDQFFLLLVMLTQRRSAYLICLAIFLSPTLIDYLCTSLHHSHRSVICDEQVGGVASVLKVPDRKSSVPENLQANKNLLMKAMAAVNKSVPAPTHGECSSLTYSVLTSGLLPLTVT